MNTLAAAVIGIASVIDGDTIEIHAQRIRLHGVDAPESRQLCQQDGKPWRCGQAAANALSDYLAEATVQCIPVGTDRYRRIVADCLKAGVNISGWMVAHGWAVDYKKYSKGAWANVEATAHAQRLGIWASEFEMPWDWRKSRR